MEAEAREILEAGLEEKDAAPTNLAAAIRRHIEPLGGVELVIPPRRPIRRPPSFD
jgi:plasmid stability protein